MTPHKLRVALAFVCAASMFVGMGRSRAIARSPAIAPGTISTPSLRSEVNGFLAKELAVHLLAIKTLQPPPDRVLGALTTGEFSWGTFMRALAAYAEESGQRELAQRDLARWIGQIGLIEAKGGGKAFSQLYAAQALRHFGSDLRSNALWLSLTPKEQESWRSLLNPERFYDPRTNRVINLAENYLGVAARIAAIDYELGISKDRAFLDKVTEKAAEQFTNGAIYADDALPTGRYDRYSNEYARYVWEAAERAGRKDILDKLRPSLTRQMKLWCDIVSEDGYGYNWGRSQGVVSYLDTPEIAGFLATHPEFRPAPLPDIAALYYQAWRYLRSDYRNDTHLLSIFAPGRGNYSYITREREWQQTTSFFGKIANSHARLMNALEKEGVRSFPAVPRLARVARFEYFRQSGGRLAGVWVVRQGLIRFALPITTGTKPGVSDYLPSPHGLPGFAAPVEQLYPALTSYIDLADGRTIVATDGADVIDPAADGQSLHARWNRWALVGSKSGELVDVGLTCDVTWRIKGNRLIREETLTSSRPVQIRQWRLALPTTHTTAGTKGTKSRRFDKFVSAAGSLEAEMQETTFPLNISIETVGDTPEGRGVRGAIPLHLIFESSSLRVEPGRQQRTKLTITLKSR